MAFPIDSPAAVPADTVKRAPLAWVPIRALSERHRPRILAHLLGLGPRDRYLRFGHPATDAQIARYVDQLDFAHDEVFGIFNRRLQVVALAHLAMLGGQAAEFGVSVAESARGRGWGARLFEHAALHARNRGIHRMAIHALSENAPMLRIVRAAGATVEMEGPDTTAWLTLPPEDFASHVEALVERQVAEFDYGVKVQVRRLDAWLRLWGGALPPGSWDDRAPAVTQPRDHAGAPSD
jgi:GNAT superfamily N-acetyltransferase